MVLNKVSLIGRLVRPIQVQQVNGDKLVCNNTLAVQRIHKAEEGQQADFIPVVFWGATATLVDQYCAKGNQIGVNGHLVSRSYINKQDQHVYVVELVVEDLYFVEAKKEQEAVSV